MTENFLDFSTFLFARPTFLGGMATVLDMGGTLFNYNSSESAEEADRVALSMDFHAVGLDMKRATERHRCGQKTKLQRIK